MWVERITHEKELVRCQQRISLWLCKILRKSFPSKLFRSHNSFSHAYLKLFSFYFVRIFQNYCYKFIGDIFMAVHGLTSIPGKLRHRIVERLEIINTTIYMCTLYTNDSTFVCAYLIRIWEFLLYFYLTLLRPLQIVSFASICAYEHTFECRQTKSQKHRLNRNKSRKTYINTQIRRTLLSCTKNIYVRTDVYYTFCATFVVLTAKLCMIFA